MTTDKSLLLQMVARSQKDFEEGRVFTHAEVKEMLRQRKIMS